MNISRSLPSAIAVVCAPALVATLAACSSPGADGGRKDGRLQVVASFYPLEFLVERIGGDHVSVTDLTKPGVEPHDLEISPRQTASVAEAGLVVHLKGLQPAVDEAIAQSGTSRGVDAASFTTLASHGGGADEGSPASSSDGAKATDPHVWLDPVKFAEIARGIGGELREADPRHAADYRKNTGTLVSELHKLDRDFAAGLKNRTTDTFITTHAAFGYLAERYGLNQESIAGLDPESEPSPARVRELHRVARHEKVSTVFSETLLDKRTARTLAGDIGLRSDVLDPVEGITGTSRGDDYLQVMRSNLAALRQAVGTK